MRTKRTLEVKYSCSPRNAEVWADGEIIARQITGFNATHLAACWNAIEAIGGDPATVGELVAALRGIVACVDRPGGTVRTITAESVMTARAALAKVGQ